MSAARRIVLGALAAALLVAVLGVSGCGPSKAEVAAQQRDECFATESRIKTAMDLVHADSGVYPNVADAVRELAAKCPAGGTYSFDPDTDTVSCSVHGHP
jgi:hypothetical protein